MRTGVRAGVYYFLIILAVGFALGVVRALALEAFPRATRLGAVLVELPIILFIAWLVCGILIKRLEIAQDAVAGVAMGVSALVLLLSAEAGLSLAMNGMSLREHFSLYKEASHIAGMIGQLAFAALPWVRVKFGRS